MNRDGKYWMSRQMNDNKEERKEKVEMIEWMNEWRKEEHK